MPGHVGGRCSGWVTWWWRGETDLTTNAQRRTALGEALPPQEQLDVAKVGHVALSWKGTSVRASSQLRGAQVLCAVQGEADQQGQRVQGALLLPAQSGQGSGSR